MPLSRDLSLSLADNLYLLIVPYYVYIYNHHLPVNDNASKYCKVWCDGKIYVLGEEETSAAEVRKTKKCGYFVRGKGSAGVNGGPPSLLLIFLELRGTNHSWRGNCAKNLALAR